VSKYKYIPIYYIIMENKDNIKKADNNKIINEKCIVWVTKMDDCFEVCTKSTDCSVSNRDTPITCKKYYLDNNQNKCSIQ
jgi:hypothetical protein